MKTYEATVRVRFMLTDEKAIPSEICFETITPDDEAYEVISWWTDDEVEEVQ